MLFTEVFKLAVGQLTDFILKIAIAFAVKYSAAAEAKRINRAFASLVIGAPAGLHRFDFFIL